jgi:hypothetical protein
LTVDNNLLRLEAALFGIGSVYMNEWSARKNIQARRLVRALLRGQREAVTAAIAHSLKCTWHHRRTTKTLAAPGSGFRVQPGGLLVDSRTTSDASTSWCSLALSPAK